MIAPNRRIFLRKLALSVLSGVMLGCAFPPSALGILACFGLVPLLLAIKDLPRLRSVLGFSYAGFLVFHLITLNWTGGYSHAHDPYMMIAGAVTMLVHPMFYWLPMSVYVLVCRQLGPRPGLYLFPLIWVAYEFSHTLSQWSFPWLTLGNTQTYDLTRIQFISITGVLGLSLWILIVNVLAYLLMVKILEGRVRLLSKGFVLHAFGIVLVYVLPSIHGAWVLHRPPDADRASGDSIAVGIVQPNVDPWDKWKGGYETVDLYLQMTSQLLDTGGGVRPGIVLWPETAFPFDILSDQNEVILRSIQSRLEKWRCALVTGLPHRVWYKDSASTPIHARREKGTTRRFDWFNSAAFLQSGEAVPRWYGKMKMVPFAERIPYAEVFQFLDFMRWDVGIGGWQIGTDTTVFTHAATGARFNTLICYESTYPGFAAEFVRRGAEFIAIITIDSWWGRMSGAFQHQQYAILRAVENRRWIARCAVGGISCFIDPSGRVFDATDLFTQRTIARKIVREHDLTFYTRHGEWLGTIAIMIVGLFIAAAAGQTFLNHRRRDQ
jgi:apolipoprotein N-acyltransferase